MPPLFRISLRLGLAPTPRPSGPTERMACAEASGLRLERRGFGQGLGRTGGWSLLLAHRQGLLAHQERCNPHLLGPRPRSRGLPVYPEPPRILFGVIGHSLQPPSHPPRELFVLHARRLSKGARITRQPAGRAAAWPPRAPPRAPCTGSPRVRCPGRALRSSLLARTLGPRQGGRIAPCGHRCALGVPLPRSPPSGRFRPTRRDYMRGAYSGC